MYFRRRLLQAWPAAALLLFAIIIIAVLSLPRSQKVLLAANRAYFEESTFRSTSSAKWLFTSQVDFGAIVVQS